MGKGRRRSPSPDSYDDEDRSRSRKKKAKRRSRSRSRDREKKRERRRSRSRSRDRGHRSRSRSRSPRRLTGFGSRYGWFGSRQQEEKPKDAKSELLKYIKTLKEEKKEPKTSTEEPLPKNDEEVETSSEKKPSAVMSIKSDTQAKLDEEMRKRREKIEAWRASRKKEASATEEDQESEGDNDRKKWTLEDDDDDEGEEENRENKMDTTNEQPPVEEDVDPLDAFMVGVNEEVKRIKEDWKKSAVPVGDPGHKPVKQEESQRGELIESNKDLMEYSSEEEDEGFSTALARLVKKHKKKELPKVDHSQLEYDEFRRDFYVEVPELSRMTEEEVTLLRESLENIQVKGKDCPKPVKTWAQCGLSVKVLDILRKNNYEKPTPIQAQAIPAVMSGRDVIGIAKTGSGKTLAFVLPMLRHILDQPPLESGDGPIGLIMTPTRELALQIHSECKKFCKFLYLQVACIYGGTGISEQIGDLKRGAEIIVCTPGRMIDMLAANSGRVTNLRRVTYLVLDEADRMFDMGFEPQVMKIVQNTRPDRQTVLFSATFPRVMEALARKILTKPVEVQVGGRSIVCRDIEQQILVIDESKKFLKLLELLGIYQEKGSVLVFVEKQDTADYLFRDLLKHGYPCMSLHGGMDQFDRDGTIADFKNGVIRLMVATSVAARGLDVKNLIMVVNFDCPNHYEDYVHRCGRTGRAGNKGYAFTFITSSQEKIAGELIKGLELAEQEIPKELKELWDKYTERLKEQGLEKKKRKRRLAIGFGGKGYKFNEEEAAQQTEKRLKQKSSLGIPEEEDDDGDALSLLTIDKIMERAFSSIPRKKDPSQPQGPETKDLPNPKSAAGKALARAQEIAEKISQTKNIGVSPLDAAQTAASEIMRGGSVDLKGAALASQIAAGINARVGAGKANTTDAILPAGVQTQQDGKEEETVEKSIRYEDEVEINDFPQQVRWRLTNRDNLDTIAELSEAGITVRGIYVAEGKKSKEGDKKLHLALEAGGERPIQVAKQELKRLVMEELTRMAASNTPQRPGRYSVV
jgi:ATP-dependent RNA helicase DDX46/PRP5